MISEELLRRAAQEYEDETLSALPTEDECTHTFSDTFNQEMKTVIRRGNRPPLRRAVRMAASFLLVLILSGSCILLFSPAARAAVQSWVLSWTGEMYVYTSTGEDAAGTPMLDYVLTEIPEGYTLWVNNRNESHGFLIYAEEATGHLLNVGYGPDNGTGALYIIPESAVKSTVPFGQTTADLYMAREEDESSCIVWVDPGTDYLISISGFFTEEELTTLAGSMTVAESSGTE